MSPRRVVVSGGTGYVGRFIVERLLADDVAVNVLGRTRPGADFFSGAVDFVEFQLGNQVPDGVFAGAEAFVHAAFDHVSGRYRGGEGDDPDTFVRRNRDGSMTLFDAAARAGVSRAVFLSSRAVYGSQPAAAELSEDTQPRPDTLYGQVKLETEQMLAAMAGPGFEPVILRVTGVYGPAGRGRRHKWTDMFQTFLSGGMVPPRIATEVHGVDVAAAIVQMLDAPPGSVAGEVVNVSDLLLDRSDLLALVGEAAGFSGMLPPRADAGAINVMSTAKLRRLGWRPGGEALLRKTVKKMLRGDV